MYNGKLTKTATYKGRTYRLLGTTTTNRGTVVAQLAFMNGAKTFFVSLDKVELTYKWADGTQVTA